MLNQGRVVATTVGVTLIISPLGGDEIVGKAPRGVVAGWSPRAVRPAVYAAELVGWLAGISLNPTRR